MWVNDYIDAAAECMYRERKAVLEYEGFDIAEAERRAKTEAEEWKRRKSTGWHALKTKPVRSATKSE